MTQRHQDGMLRASRQQRVRFDRMLSALLALMLLLPVSCGAGAQILHHDIEAEIRPQDHAISVVDIMTFLYTCARRSSRTTTSQTRMAQALAHEPSRHVLVDTWGQPLYTRAHYITQRAKLRQDRIGVQLA